MSKKGAENKRFPRLFKVQCFLNKYINLIVKILLSLHQRKRNAPNDDQNRSHDHVDHFTLGLVLT